MFLSRFGVKNYKCLGDIDIPLTPIHVLSGQNDSGKTSLMEAGRARSCRERSTEYQVESTECGLRSREQGPPRGCRQRSETALTPCPSPGVRGEFGDVAGSISRQIPGGPLRAKSRAAESPRQSGRRRPAARCPRE